MFLQAASVGIALIILANILRRLIGRQGGNAPVIRGRTVSTGDSRVSAVELDLQSVDFDSVLSTATVGVASSRAVAECRGSLGARSRQACRRLKPSIKMRAIAIPKL